jgi:DNA repair exonuclease SbcCD ATPase subunit
MTREELLKKKEDLTKELKRVSDELNAMDKEIYHGKLDKAILLLRQVDNHLGYPVVEIDGACCPDCGCRVEVDLSDIVQSLENLMREEF